MLHFAYCLTYLLTEFQPDVLSHLLHSLLPQLLLIELLYVVLTEHCWLSCCLTSCLIDLLANVLHDFLSHFLPELLSNLLTIFLAWIFWLNCFLTDWPSFCLNLRQTSPLTLRRTSRPRHRASDDLWPSRHSTQTNRPTKPPPDLPPHLSTHCLANLPSILLPDVLPTLFTETSDFVAAWLPTASLVDN